MCRFALYLGPPVRLSQLVTEPTNSIIHQSYDSKERPEPLNGDGFGVAWYVPEIRPEPAVFRSTTPAWNNHNLLNLAPVTVSHCLLAHVRAATPGLPVTHLNCHPFQRKRFAFMHNGSVGGFSMIKRHIRERLSDHAYNAIQGSTDSEHVLALMGDAYDSAAEEDPLDRMAAALCQAVNQVESLRTAAGVEEQSCHSLYWASGCLVVERGEGRVVEGGEGTPAVIVASEPLGPDTAWKPVPPNHLVRVSGDRTVEVVKM